MPFYKSNKIQIEKFNMFLLSSSVQIMYYAVGLSNSSATQLVHVWIHVCNSCLDPKITLTHKLQYGASSLTCFGVCLTHIKHTVNVLSESRSVYFLQRPSITKYASTGSSFQVQPSIPLKYSNCFVFYNEKMKLRVEVFLFFVLFFEIGLKLT